MRYPPGHKQETRKRIIDAAARLFRQRGYEGTGVQDIMKEAGLTHGGFYGHFASKQALLQEVMTLEADFVRRLAARTGSTGAELRDQAIEVCAGYLAPENMEAIGRGCPMATLAVDVARAGKRTRNAFARGLHDLEREFARGLPDARTPDPRALAALALAVGGVILGRACGDKDMQSALLAAAHEGVAQLLERPLP